MKIGKSVSKAFSSIRKPRGQIFLSTATKSIDAKYLRRHLQYLF